MRMRGSGPLVAGACGAVLVAAAFAGVKAQQAPAAAPTIGSQLFPLFDANSDGSVTAAELKTTFDRWYDAADTARAGKVTQDQLAAAISTALGAPAPAAPAAGGAGAAAGGGRGAGGAGAAAPGAAAAGGGRAATAFVAGATTPGLNDPCGARSQNPTVACITDVQQMEAALPATAPAKPLKARKVLVFSRIPSSGYQHSSIPLAMKTIEALGKKTGAWTTDWAWDPKMITAENLKQYDAIFLSSTTGCFFDDATDVPGTLARRQAFVDFVRSGKGVAGVHATGDSYHGGGAACVPDPALATANGAAAGGGRGGGRGGGTPGASLASVILRWNWGLDDKKLQANDLTLSKAEMEAVSDAWYNQIDPGKAGKVSQAAFMNAIVPVATQANQYVGSPGRDQGRGSWQDWNNMIGGWFKFHWLDPQHIVFKIDDKNSPLTSMFGGKDYDVYDETYTFSVQSSFKDVHLLTSINYDKMSFMDKLKESSPRPDHISRLSWIKKEGQGRVFYMALGHDERIYALPAMLQHLLAGMQYALGDLKADDSPTK